MPGDKTEKPTPRRRQKAREQGQVARSRELSSAIAVAGTLGIVSWQAAFSGAAWRNDLAHWLETAAGGSSLGQPVLLWAAVSVLRWIGPALLVAWSLALASSVAQGGFTWAPAALAFRPDRLSPSTRIKQLFSVTAISNLLRSLLPGTVIVYLGATVLAREWDRLRFASFASAPSLIVWIFGLLFEIAWKSALVMLLWSVADYLLVRYRTENDLMMSRNELRQEHKEAEGDPIIKARIRKLQRQVRRHKMMQDVAKAAVVVTNPTHYAIALAYNESTPAPVVVAKGRDQLALQIKDAARWHEVPMVENPPLAHALYRAVPVGNAIPSKLYIAVAEILAYVYRAQARVSAAQRSQ